MLYYAQSSFYSGFEVTSRTSRDGAAAWKDFMDSEIFIREPGRYWGYAYVKPRAEKKVVESLGSRGLPVYLPLVPRARMHHSTKVISHVPMIPGYVFLSASDEERRELKMGERHIVLIELLRDRLKEESFIEELKTLRSCEELAKSEPVLINPEIVAGDQVEVISGPLAGLCTRVVRRADDVDTIIINLPILNVHVEYPVSPETLKKITK